MPKSFTIFSLTIKYYDLFFVLGFVGVMAYRTAVNKKYGFPWWKTLLYGLMVYSATTAWMFVLYYFETGSWGGNNVVRVFWWLGVISFPVSRLLRMDFLKSLDCVAPCLCINHAIAHIGCIFAGCCHGYESSWGIYSNNARHVCFPIQPIEAAAALAIAVIIWNRERKKGYGKGTDGLSFPIMLMLFGYSRFFFEFLRDDDKIIKTGLSIGNVPLDISTLALHALLNGVIGTVAYFVIKYYNKKKALKFLEKAPAA